MRSELSFCLLQIRNASDPMRQHEVECFVRRMDIAPAQLTALDVLHDPLGADIFERFDALMIGGAGEFSVLDDVPPIRALLEFVGRAVDHGFPTFGSCFGYQALSLVLGGEVVNDRSRAEVGTCEVELTEQASDDLLFAALPRQFAVQQGHKDHVVRLPSMASHIARSDRSVHQASRFGDGLIWGTQFHPELSAEDNRHRVMTYHERYADQLDEVLASLRPSEHAHGLLAQFVDLLAAADLQSSNQSMK